MKRVLAAFARNTVFANIVLVLIFLSGGIATMSMIRENFPEFSMDMIVDAIRRSSLNLAGGTIRTRGEEIRVRTLGRKYTGEALSAIVFWPALKEKSSRWIVWPSLRTDLRMIPSMP
jgi:multidrug efflux pump subunit AcrB